MAKRVMSLVAAAAVGAATLTACQTTEYAKAPIPMSGKAAALYQTYKNLKNPGYFAVSKDGKAGGGSYCPDVGNCSGNSIYLATSICEQNSMGEPCVIYAYMGKPVFGDEYGGEPQAPSAIPQTTTVIRGAERASPQRTVADRLRELQSLLDQKLITTAEYETRRRAVLDGL